MSHFDLHLSQGMRNRETLFKKKSEKDDRIKHPTFTTTNAIDRAYRFGVQVLRVFISGLFILYILPTFDVKYFVLLLC